MSSSSTALARVGRDRQRYENELRLVAGCIPYKLKTEGSDLIYRLEVLMIATPNRHDLVFPKGGWENDESMSEAASREALEEAGVRGILNETILGEWIFRSKSRQNSCSNVGACKGYMFALEVHEELEYWPEQSTHKRIWVSVADAFRLSRYPWMCEALTSCIKLLSKNLGLQQCTPSNNLFERTSNVSEQATCTTARDRTANASKPSNFYFNVKSTAPDRAIDVSEPSDYYFKTNSAAPERATDATVDVSSYIVTNGSSEASRCIVTLCDFTKVMNDRCY
ncbi:uncharacterized protein A4U43_C09F15140 [Asparagus officinalis]|uniref:Nudix hydrolase domain-containing protein n=1 Tax=Asparagus officinalis TaxID=4686 RepID=A0A5P1E7M9_ASPOF|nr:nudix hydrolase 12, mitochondrial-like isoform X2 [Asparagus officinalis]ONK58641.1 uncharacterized protein A4U43_C09F15140 [Asparagus officinalis]